MGSCVCSQSPLRVEGSLPQVPCEKRCFLYDFKKKTIILALMLNRCKEGIIFGAQR